MKLIFLRNLILIHFTIASPYSICSNIDTDYQQTDYIKASNTDANDLFGNSVAVSNNLMVIGSNKEASNSTGVNNDSGNNLTQGSGAAYIFAFVNENKWIQSAYLKASNTDINDGFGFSVAISGNTAVIGAPFEASNATTINGNQSDNSKVGSGAVYVFVFQNTNWVQQAYLKANNTDAFDNFGYSVAISNNTIVIGAPSEMSDASIINGDVNNNEGFLNGAAYVYKRSETQWQQQAYLKAPNTSQGDLFGYSVAISGDHIIVGAPEEDSDGNNINNNSISNSGAAYLFKRENSTWSHLAYLKASNIGENDQFGRAVSLSNNTAIVGAVFESSNANGVNGDENNDFSSGSGASYVFRTTNDQWSQMAYLKSQINLANANFGQAVSIVGNKIAVGSNANNSPGAVDIYVYKNDAWQYENTLNASNSDAGDRFGAAVSIDGRFLLSGAYRESSASSGINGNGDDNNAFSSGAAYIYQDFETVFINGFE